LADAAERAFVTPWTKSRVWRELFGFRRDTIGADLMGEIIVGTPGFGQLA
jgi:hypothetical protein